MKNYPVCCCMQRIKKVMNALFFTGTKSLDCLVDETWVLLQQVLVVGERVVLKVKSGGKS